ncbi:MAG: sulfotransferase family 2 domain-containing protein [Rhizobiaceae bacterium]
MVGVLNTELGFVFVHIPKCAGSSISHSMLLSDSSIDFRAVPGLRGIVERDNSGSDEKIGDIGHARARQVRELLGHRTFDAMNSFAVVRNPWDRLVSRYHFLRRSARGDLPSHLAGSFSEFVLWACRNRPSTQFDRIADRHGNVLVKDILMFENLQAEFEQYSTRLFGVARSLPSLNKAPELKFDAWFSKEACEVVKSAYADDFAAFGYSDHGPPDYGLRKLPAIDASP